MCLIFVYVYPLNESIQKDALPISLKNFFMSGLLGIRKSTQIAVLRIRHRILRLTSEMHSVIRDFSRSSFFVAYTVFEFRI